MKKQTNKYAIKVKNLTKQFKINSDKPRTLKEKILFSNRNKVEKHTVLRDITLNIEKGEPCFSCDFIVANKVY